MMTSPRLVSALESPLLRSVVGACLLCLAAAPVAAQTPPAQTTPAQTTPTPTPPAANNTLETKLNEAVAEFIKDPHFKSVPEKEMRERIEFVAGNVIFATVHEVGHMLITELGLPVLGREEDAADSFAVLTGLKLNNALSDRILTQSARGWYLSDRRSKKEKVKMVFYDEHGLDQQRAYNIVCLMVGSNPKKYSELADLAKMPDERQGTCQGDYSNASWSWQKVLEPNIRKPDQPKVPVDVKYNESQKYGIYARALRELGVLDSMAAYISDRFALRGPFTFEATECGEPGAHWDLSIRKIVICYELAADFGDLYRGYAHQQKPKKSASHKR